MALQCLLFNATRLPFFIIFIVPILDVISYELIIGEMIDLVAILDHYHVLNKGRM